MINFAIVKIINHEMNPMKSITKIINAVALTTMAVIAVGSGNASAAPFIPGDIVVLQEDDGSVATSTAASPVFLLEFLPSTANQVVPVQTISIPTTGSSRLTQSSGSSSEGFIARSTDSSIVTFVGYDAPVGTANVPGTSSSSVNRYVGQVDKNGNYTRTAGTSTAYNGSNIRSSVSDGVNYWTSGTASPTTTEGIWYSASGGTPIQITTSPLVNTRVTRIFNGNLYYSVAASISGYSGLPTVATAGTATGMTSSSIYDFAINPGGTVAYVCDDSALPTGGIIKWTYSAGTWTKKFTFGSANGLTAGCRGLAVDFSGANPVIYTTTADTAQKVISITDTSAFADTSDSADQATILATAPPNTAFRGVALAPPSSSTGTAPSISGISPSNTTNSAGTTVTFTLTGGVGYPAASNFWYKISGGTTNLISSATAPSLTLSNVSTADTASYFAILTNASGSATSSVASLTVVSAPSISGILPSSVTVNAGQTVTFTLTATTGNPVASNFWYKIVDTTTNLIPSATATTLTLSNVLGGDTASYFAILTNASGRATSSVVTLTVTGDPGIAAQPANAYGLLDGTVQFTVTVIGTGPLSYQWYFADGSGNIIAPVSNGQSTASGVAVVSGAKTSTLTVTNLQFIDPTNWMVVVTNVYGAVTSSVASLLAVDTTAATLAFWDFNGPEFTNYVVNPNCVNNPVPYLGAGSAQAVGSTYNPGPYPFTSTSFSPFSGSVDPNDGLGFTSHLPPFSWGTDHYPLTGGNKQNGVQFNVSTVGAKNIKVAYQSRVSATASDYERLQYTTDGINWVDYPASSTFGGVGTTYLQYNYDLTGFPGVANNPNFGIRIVTEYQSTATYGLGTTNGYVGTANSYSSGGANGFAAGTVTYDLVTFTGDAITNNNAPPTLAGFMDTNMVDYLPLTINFTASDDTTPPGSLQYSAVSLNMATFNPTFSFGGSGQNRTLTIHPNSIAQSLAAAPILVTATDANGDSTVAWFTVTVGTVNLPPTNSLTMLSATNTLANSTLVIPFSVGDDRTPVSGLTYSVASGNNTLIPSGNIVVTPNGANPTVTITPATNQLGVGVVSVTVYDNDLQAPKSTTANIAIMVRPNTNIVAIDYFNYDQSGALDAVSGGFWQHLSGVYGQMQVGSGVVTVDTFDNTENLQTPLLGAPYITNSGAILYASFIVNMNDPTRQPVNNGTYFSAFNDGSGVTADVEDCLVVATNGAAPGYYRLGIANIVGATALAPTQMFPQDLVPGTNYMVVTALSLTNGFSTLWVNPSSQSSPSVTNTSVLSGTNVLTTYNISDFELRESGASGGSVSVSYLKVGTTFDSVFPSLQVQPAGTQVIVNWSDPTLGIQSATNVTGPYTDVSPASPPYTNNASTNGVMFFRFGQ